MDITNVERSFGELLAAFGDLGVARTRGAPARAVGGSTRALARRYRARRRAFDVALDRVAGGSAGRKADARALANMRATLPWLDDVEPTPGARPTPGGTTDEEPAVARSRAALYRRYGQ